MSDIFQGNVALVTGAGFGLGRASAIAFAKRGAKVVVADVNRNNGKETIDIIKGLGHEAIFVYADVSKASEVENLIGETVQAYGRLDFAHNNAGIMEPIPLLDVTEEQWDHTMAVNLKGVWLCMKYELIQMTSQGSGAIVNTSSVAGLMASPGNSLYAASKWGINGLTKSAAVEFAERGIRINAICPTVIQGTSIYLNLLDIDPGFSTRLSSEVPLKRNTSPEEIAEKVIWLCSDEASYIIGHTMPIDGGRSIV